MAETWPERGFHGNFPAMIHSNDGSTQGRGARAIGALAAIPFVLLVAAVGCGSGQGMEPSGPGALERAGTSEGAGDDGAWLGGAAAGDRQAAAAGKGGESPLDTAHAKAAKEGGKAGGADVGQAARAKAAPERKPSRDWAPGSHNDGKPRIAAIGPHVWISPKPAHGGLALGKLRLGTSVRLRAPGRVDGENCKGGWYAVEPRGYVCNNDRTTLDTKDPYFLALAAMAPRPGDKWPYHYAHSRGAPMYGRVPTPEEWQKAELSLGPPGTYGELGEWAAGHEELIEKDTPIKAEDEVPWFFEGGQRHVHGGTFDPRVLKWKTIPNGSMLAYARSFEMHGRVWLVTPELMIVPADRVQYMRRSTFHGVALGKDVTLPLAWNLKHEPIPIYRRQPDGSFVETERTLAGKAWIEVAEDNDFTWDMAKTPQPKFLRLRDDPNLAVRKWEVTFTVKKDKLPNSVKPGQKWLDARILPGTMTAYLGEEPIYATLFSPGKGGLPVKGLDHTIYATTQTGYFPLEWKERVATMSNEKGDPKVLWFSDVPNVQYLRAPLAMHVAYWHEDFGNKKSAECLNLSATDGQFIFGFTDPPLPEDWNAVRPGGGNGLSTPVVVSGW